MSSGHNFVGNKEIVEKVCKELCSVRLVQQCALVMGLVVTEIIPYKGFGG
jgi:hypothetical protein